MQPIWAQSARGRQMHTPNFVMPKHGAHQVNGKHHDGPTRADRTMSRHASPEATRAAAAAAAAHVTAPVEPPGLAEACSTIGPWEPTILNKRPYEEVSRSIADFIYIHGINNPDLPQIQRHGAHLEIEAKLGYLINKNTTERVQLPIATECLLQDTGKIAFKSTMTEVS